MNNMVNSNTLTLVTGATGYVGSRLSLALLKANVPLRCMARQPQVLQDRFGDAVDVVKADVLDPESLSHAMKGVQTAYYLIHALSATGDLLSLEEEGARNFAHAARKAGVQRIIFLGGLSNGNSKKSEHMKSRHAVGDILRASGIPTLEFRASIIIGSGSLSYDLIRSLVHKLPVMITPRWVSMSAQPIAIQDVLAYLLEARKLDPSLYQIYEIGGQDLVSYLELMKAYADRRGLKRAFLPVPVLTPWLSSLWLALITPVLARVGKKLIASITEPSVVHQTSATRVFAVRPMGVEEALEAADKEHYEEAVLSHWSSARSSATTTPIGEVPDLSQCLIDNRRRQVNCTAAEAFRPIRRIGGQQGWYFANMLWKIRGALDRAVGGVGLRRGRRNPEFLYSGDVVDCWRVVHCRENYSLLMQAEMKMPGKAWLRFDILPNTEGGVTITQTAIFKPSGVWGRMYWYSLYPLHAILFSGMLRAIARNAGKGNRERLLPTQQFLEASSQ